LRAGGSLAYGGSARMPKVAAPTLVRNGARPLCAVPCVDRFLAFIRTGEGA
jgi:hypothetical protein